MNNLPQFRDCYLSVKNYRSTAPPPKMVKTLPPNSSLPLVTLNRPDIHQEIVNNYIKYSEAYWIGVRRRQRAYLDDKKYNESLNKQQKPPALILRSINPPRYIAACVPTTAPVVSEPRTEDPLPNYFLRKLSSCYKL